MASHYMRELPGDVLLILMGQHKVGNVAEFHRQHELRVGDALEKQLEREGRLETVSEKEVEEMFDDLAPRYQQWNNRSNVTWDAEKNPRAAWRATMTCRDIDALIFAGWFDEGSEMHVRFQNAVRLQNALYFDRFPYRDLERIFDFDQKIDLSKVYDALCYRFSEFLRSHPETSCWSFTTMATFASGISRDVLGALVDLGIMDLPPDWESELPGLERTRGVALLKDEEAGVLLERIGDWVELMLEDRLEGMRT